MICSMTGYGSGDGLSGKTALHVELKSVNNRFLDCAVRLPRSCSFAEEQVKSLVQSRVGRGKVDVFVTVDSSQEDDVQVTLNEPLLRAYKQAVEEMRKKFLIPDDMGTAAYSRIPDVFVLEKKELDQEVFLADLSRVATEALDSFCAMRVREGERLKTDLLGKLDELEAMRQTVAARSPETVREYREKLLARMQEVLGSAGIDESRILTEAALFADKVAVDEELVRLDSHLRQFRDLLDAGGAVGRKLDFLIQELNREVNTIGSKCVDLDITKLVVEMKSTIEKIREQAQNIE